MQETRIYLDNNATTPAAAEVVEAMLPWFRERPGNASSVHAVGCEAAAAVTAARAALARLIGARPAELVFTSGGTESINTAVRGVLAARGPDRRRIVTSTVEHTATLKAAEAWGGEVTRVGVDGDCRLDTERVLAELARGDVALVSLLWANNETGVVLPESDRLRIGEAARAAGARFHLDAVQAVGKLPVDVANLPLDLLSLSAHKFHGPKGAGALWIRSGVDCPPLLVGGAQERERRAGTLAVPLVVGLGRAAELARADLAGASARDGSPTAALRDRLEAGLLERLPETRVHARRVPRVPGTTSIEFAGLDGEALLMLLSELGLAVATGSACDAERRAPSHVLLAMGLDRAAASATLRFSLSRETTAEEVERALELVATAAGQLRALSLPPGP